MDIAYKKSFLKDLQKLPSDIRSRIQQLALQEAPALIPYQPLAK